MLSFVFECKEETLTLNYRALTSKQGKHLMDLTHRTGPITVDGMSVYILTPPKGIESIILERTIGGSVTTLTVLENYITTSCLGIAEKAVLKDMEDLTYALALVRGFFSDLNWRYVNSYIQITEIAKVE